MINTEQHTPAANAGRDESFQARVRPWMMACFGSAIAADGAERNHRFLEESLELVQACGCTASEAHQLVDYVYGRPVGERAQEVGGVMVTLAALCLAQRLDMHAAGETELTRIWTKVEAIRAKQAAKPKHSALPAAAALQAVADEWTQFVDWASAEGLIRESFGIRSTSSMCDVALKAWKAGRAALAAAPMQAQVPVAALMYMDELPAAQAGEKWIQKFASEAAKVLYAPDEASQAVCVKWCAYFDSYDRLIAAYLLTRDLKNWTQLTKVRGEAFGTLAQPMRALCTACGGSGHAADAAAGSAP